MDSSNSDGVSDKTGYRDYWTTWYNVDTPLDDGGDYETVDRILKVYNKICNKGYEIAAARCQVESQGNEVFDANTHPSNNSDALERHCTTDGVICKNGDQSPGSGLCQDYQIQFQCHYTGDSTSSLSYFNAFDIRVYVILALVPLLLIFTRMLWVYLYRRRQYRARNPQPRESNESNENNLTKSPPTYQELFGKDGSSIFAISRENLPVCSWCRCTPCSVALVVSKMRASDNSKGMKHTAQMESRSASHVAAAVQTVNAISNTVNANNTSVDSNAFNLYQMASSNESACVNSSELTDVCIEITSNRISPNHEPALEPDQMNGMDYVNNNMAHGELYPRRNILTRSQTSVSSTSCEAYPGSSHPALSLNQVPLKSSNISEPCPCKCHRIVPSKHEGVSGYDNSGYTAADEDTDTNTQRVYVNMHRAVLGNVGVRSDACRSPSLTQLELPTYEDALELMKLKENQSLEDIKK
ncbi:hypothetical protein BsWGS_09720 [Bradybaena similaris]